MSSDEGPLTHSENKTYVPLRTYILVLLTGMREKLSRVVNVGGKSSHFEVSAVFKILEITLTDSLLLCHVLLTFLYTWTSIHMHIIGQICWPAILFLLEKPGLNTLSPPALTVSWVLWHRTDAAAATLQLGAASCQASWWERGKGLLCQDHWREWVSEWGPVQWDVSHMRTCDQIEGNDGYARWTVQKVWTC